MRTVLKVYLSSDLWVNLIRCKSVTFGNYPLITHIGIIIGSDLVYNDTSKRIEIVRENYKDIGSRPQKSKKGKSDPLEKLILNTYYTLLTRGSKGWYVYICDDSLRAYIDKNRKTRSN